MKRSDWIGLGISLAVHALLLLLLSAWKSAPPPPEMVPIGYVEINMGDYAQGRPVRSAPEEPEVEEAPEQPKPAERVAPEAPQPIDLPDALPTQDEPLPDATKPSIEPEPAPPQPEPEKPAPKPLGQPNTTRETGANTGDDGAGNDEQRASPYDIEGLNRVPRVAPLPAYVNKVNATIRVRITVAPDGRVVARVPMRKDDPALEAEVMRALERWRFNPLPSAAPQERQTGTITFTFRLN